MRVNLASLREMDPNMSIGDLISNIDKKNQEREIENSLIRQRVIDQFSGKYLKIYEPNGLFGENLDVYKIDLIKSSGYDTDFIELYSITGTKISFGDRDVSMFDIDGECRYSFSYKQLQEGQLIDEIEYNDYLSQYTQIKNTLKMIINGKI